MQQKNTVMSGAVSEGAGGGLTKCTLNHTGTHADGLDRGKETLGGERREEGKSVIQHNVT